MLRSGPHLVRAASIGTGQTITVEVEHDSVSALTDAELGLEGEVLGTSGFTLSSFLFDRVASPLATPANHAASVVGWTTTVHSNANKQKLTAAVTPAEIGYYAVWVVLMKPSYTLYHDKPTVA